VKPTVSLRACGARPLYIEKVAQRELARPSAKKDFFLVE